MKKSIKWLIGVLICIIAFVGIYYLYDFLKERYQSEQFSSDEDSSQQSTEHRAPDFMVYDADGNEVKLSNYFGKPIVLNFWATWCYYCKEEMSDFDAAYKKHADVQFFMVNVTDGHQETKEIASKYIEEKGYDFPIFYDLKLEAATTYRATGLPMTVFIDKNGDLVTYANGMLSAENLEKGIKMIK